MAVKHEFVAEVEAVERIENKKVARVLVPNARIDGEGPADISFHLPADGFYVGQRVRVKLEPEVDSGTELEWT
ncbi:MAG: hypothetical protein ACRD4U_09120 [Candidatus Acidiferrales bacterium]